MFELLDYEIDKLIEEDVPYLDLTSHLLDIKGDVGRIKIFTREKGIACGTEEVIKIFKKFDIEMESCIYSGEHMSKGDNIIIGKGKVDNLHKAWKVSQNILDHCSGIATKTYNMLEKARRNNSDMMILTTRKSFPGTRKLATKAIMAGGGLPHRLNMSETILVFKNHLNLIGGIDGLIKRMPALRSKACEKKILVETADLTDAKRLAAAGVHAIQFEKLIYDHLKDHVAELKKEYPDITILVAGGINEQNVETYSDKNIDGIITSCLYEAKPLDCGTKIELVE
ncbi:MAG: ModD protein [Firmicutes bacterium]|nr:ModD protein [Bacillota bacterium]